MKKKNEQKRDSLSEPELKGAIRGLVPPPKEEEKNKSSFETLNRLLFFGRQMLVGG